MQIEKISTNPYLYTAKMSAEPRTQITAVSGGYNPAYYAPAFKSASDITLKYVLEKQSAYIPARILDKIKELVSSGKDKLFTLPEVHSEVYKKLFEAKTLDEVKTYYPEFREVIDMSEMKNNRSKAVKAVQSIMPLEDFTLQYLKELYLPTSQDNLVKKYGFTNRNLLLWLNSKLNIKKLSGEYIMLLKLSDEKENRRYAQMTSNYLKNNDEVRKNFFEKASDAHKTAEYREKKRNEMVRFYQNNPEKREKVRLISSMTWERCSEIKKEFQAYTKAQSGYVKVILKKKCAGMTLTDVEKRIVGKYYKDFWKSHPEFAELYRKTRMEVIEEINRTI